MKNTYAVLAVLLLVIGCTSSDQKGEKATMGQTIRPAFADADVPFKEFTFRAEEGDTLYHASGSIFLLPPNALVDKEGKLVEGNVRITYREFSDPLHFFMSGIPMSYDYAGTSYVFESSRICEIYGYKDSIPVFINPEHRPEIHLASDNRSEAQIIRSGR
jgi:hypothetical protein